MNHAANGSRDADQIPRHKHLKNWTLSTTWHAEWRPGIVKVGELGQVNPLRTLDLTPSTQTELVRTAAEFGIIKGARVWIVPKSS